MIKETVTYEDFNGVQRTEDFYFNMTRTELMALQLEVPGGLSELLEGIIRSDNAVAVYEQLQVIMTRAYGIKSEDGRRFEKSPEIVQDFITTEAYSELVYQLMEEPDRLAAFFEGIMPKKLQKEAQSLNEKFETREEVLEYIDEMKKEGNQK